jgi:hypothetical protein
VADQTVDHAKARAFAINRARTWLRELALSLGSKLSVQRPSEWPGPYGEPINAVGQVAICSACSKVVGVFPMLAVPDPLVPEGGNPCDPVFLDPTAGQVLERRFEFMKGAFICGRSGCDTSPSYHHPIACSDECESRILFDPRFEECDPGPGYKRFAAGLEAG